MPQPTPLLADFALRLAGGLAILLLVTRRRAVPPAFFRTHCQIVLALLVLAALDLGRLGASRPVEAGVVAAAVVAYLASACWGLGLPRLGVPATSMVAAVVSALLIVASRRPTAEGWAIHAAGRLASAFLLGATLSAMLLGHHYLTAPSMTIDPLRRYVLCMAIGLAVRVAIEVVGLGARGGTTTVEPMFLAMRWGMGFAGPALAMFLAWRTVVIRSTQSATGILYIAFAFVLFGEISAMVLARGGGVVS
ncbi:MAG TPA: hypothetical protein VG406_12380 [Isosphaeraceae bacterium]|jgi:hypothetical protein|nr:hypothetical protein [Isosphaeraceae bacterium]